MWKYRVLSTAISMTVFALLMLIAWAVGVEMSIWTSLTLSALTMVGSYTTVAIYSRRRRRAFAAAAAAAAGTGTQDAPAN